MCSHNKYIYRKDLHNSLVLVCYFDSDHFYRSINVHVSSLCAVAALQLYS